MLLVNKTWGDVPLWKENGLGPEIESWGQSAGAGAVGSGRGRRDDMGASKFGGIKFRGSGLLM